MPADTLPPEICNDTLLIERNRLMLRHALDLNVNEQHFDIVICLDCFYNKKELEDANGFIQEWAEEKEFAFTILPQAESMCCLRDGKMHFINNRRMNMLQFVFITRKRFPMLDVTFPYVNPAS